MRERSVYPPAADRQEAWLADNTPALWSFLSRQTVPATVAKAPVAAHPRRDDLKDTLRSLPSIAARADLPPLELLDASTCEQRVFQSLKAHVLQTSNAFIVVYSHWVYLPEHRTAINLHPQSATLHQFLRLPAVTLGGVKALQRAFQLDPTFRPARVDCVLLQRELLLCKPLTEDEVAREQRWTDDLAVCIALSSTFAAQKRELEHRGLTELYRLTREAQEPIAMCQALGCAFDSGAHISLVSLWKVRLQNYASELRTIFGDINIASNPQLSQALKTYLEKVHQTSLLRSWPKTSTKLLKTDISTLRLFRSHEELMHPLDLIVEYRTLLKADCNFGASLQTHVKNGRLHSIYKLNGCVTGRLSSSEPNLQNIPHTPEFRKLFTSSEGHCLVIGDFSQIELRMAALLSKDPVMLECYRKREDLHLLTACALLNTRKDQVTHEQRRLAKAVNFGTLYGQGAKALSHYCKANYSIDVSLEAAQTYISKFRDSFKALRDWQERLMQSPTAETPLGRKRTAEFITDSEKLNMPIQGGAAEVMLLALIYCHRAVRKMGAVIVNIVHDELVLEVPIPASAECVEAVKKAMNRAFDEYSRFLGVNEAWDVADVVCGEDWSRK